MLLLLRPFLGKFFFKNKFFVKFFVTASLELLDSLMEELFAANTLEVELPFFPW